jgi:hypothetical protein
MTRATITQRMKKAWTLEGALDMGKTLNATITVIIPS